jgi:hypothetical protein
MIKSNLVNKQLMFKDEFFTTIIFLLFFFTKSFSQIMPSYHGFNKVQSTANSGLSSAEAASSAEEIKQNYPSATDGVYWIDLPNVGPTEVYCLMDNAYDGGGWMLAMKATQGTTFSFNSSYWTSSNTLNTTSLNRSDGDAKFEVMNQFPGTDLMALWPDISNIGSESGSIDGLSLWSWLKNNFDGGSESTLISKFSEGEQAIWTSTNGSFSFDGYNTSVFSRQYGYTFYGFNYVINNKRVRWGMVWNNESCRGCSEDAAGGIGLDSSWGNYSAGDRKNWSGVNVTGINRKARVEIYVR